MFLLADLPPGTVVMRSVASVCPRVYVCLSVLFMAPTFERLDLQTSVSHADTSSEYLCYVRMPRSSDQGQGHMIKVSK